MTPGKLPFVPGVGGGDVWSPAHPRRISEGRDLNLAISGALQGRLDRKHHLLCSAVAVLESERGEEALKIKNQSLLPKEATSYYSTRSCVSYNWK